MLLYRYELEHDSEIAVHTINRPTGWQKCADADGEYISVVE